MNPAAPLLVIALSAAVPAAVPADGGEGTVADVLGRRGGARAFLDAVGLRAEPRDAKLVASFLDDALDRLARTDGRGVGGFLEGLDPRIVEDEVGEAARDGLASLLGRRLSSLGPSEVVDVFDSLVFLVNRITAWDPHGKILWVRLRAAGGTEGGAPRFVFDPTPPVPALGRLLAKRFKDKKGTAEYVDAMMEAVFGERFPRTLLPLAPDHDRLLAMLFGVHEITGSPPVLEMLSVVRNVAVVVAAPGTLPWTAAGWGAPVPGKEARPPGVGGPPTHQDFERLFLPMEDEMRRLTCDDFIREALGPLRH